MSINTLDVCGDLLERIWFTPLYVGSFVSIFVVGSVVVTWALGRLSPIFRRLPQHKQRDTIIYLTNSIYYACAVVPFSMTAAEVLTAPLEDWDLDGQVRMGGRVVCLGMFVYFLDMVYRGQPPRMTLILHHVMSFALFSSAVDPVFCSDISNDQELESFTFRIRLLFLRCVVISSEFPIFVLLATHKLHRKPKYVYNMARVNILLYPVLQLGGHVGHIILMVWYWADLQTGWKVWYSVVLVVIVIANWFTQAMLLEFAKTFANPKTRRSPITNAWTFDEENHQSEDPLDEPHVEDNTNDQVDFSKSSNSS